MMMMMICHVLHAIAYSIENFNLPKYFLMHPTLTPPKVNT